MGFLQQLREFPYQATSVRVKGGDSLAIGHSLALLPCDTGEQLQPDLGECLLRFQGNAEAAVQLEHLREEIVKTYDLDILCEVCVDILSARTAEIKRAVLVKNTAFSLRLRC